MLALALHCSRNHDRTARLKENAEDAGKPSGLFGTSARFENVENGV
jgi:hypothetical protein